MNPIDIYRLLDTTQNQIRLIHILPKYLFSNRPNDIFCTIRPISLNDAAGTYKSLSYAWGTEVSHSQIYLWIEGSEIPVTVQENLYQALVHFRDIHEQKSTGALVLWVDALCINQSDEIEKSHQVKQMRSVYEKASAVCVWLGVAANGSDQLLQTMRKIREMAMELEREVAGSWVNVMPNVITSNDEEATFPLDDMIAFLSRPWWSRIWVVQEVAAADTVFFYCGHQRITDLSMYISISCFISMLDTCSTKPHSTRTDYESRAASIQDFSIRMSLVSELPFNRSGLERELPRLITRLRQWYMSDPSRSMVMEATDPRDFVFSLLGICRDAEELGLQPDYTKSREEVFIDTATAILQTGNMEFLSLAQNCKEKSELPSWVPDWGELINHTLQDGPWHLSQTVSEHFANSNLDLRPYMASQGLKPKMEVTRLPDQVPYLTVSAIELFRVCEVIGPTPQSASAYTKLFQFWDAIFSAAQSATDQEQPYESLEDAVFCLLTLDRERVDKEGLWTICRARKDFSSSARKAYKSWKEEHCHTIPEFFLEELKTDESLALFSVTSSTVTAGLQAFVTEKGYVGMVSNRVTKGDIVVVLAGADVPFILRIDDEGYTRLVGEAYVQGVMNGEVVEMGLPVADIDLY